MLLLLLPMLSAGRAKAPKWWHYSGPICSIRNDSLRGNQKALQDEEETSSWHMLEDMPFDFFLQLLLCCTRRAAI